MAYSYIKISAAAGQTSVPFSFDYLSTTEIKVSINDIEITAWSLSSPNVVALNTPLAGGEVVEIERVTNLTTRAVDFSSGAVLTEEDLDLSAQQVFNAAQEALDSTEKNLSLDYTNNYDAKGRRITDVANAVDPGDVITKGQLTYDYPAVEIVANNMTDVNTVASNITDINTVEDNITDINTVAGNISSVNAVGTNITNVNKVAVIDTDVTSVAGISSDVSNVAGNIANINIVGGISSDVSAVAGISSDVTDVANNLTEVTNFADVYLGAKASDPSTRNDGTALQAGDLYFNTTVDELRTYSGSQWVSGTAGTMAVQRFTGDGTTTAFTLSTAPSGENNTQVYVNGIYQQKDTYSVSGTSLTLTEAPQSDEEVEVVTISTLALGETDASLVSYTSSATGAVPRTVQDKLGETVSVLDFGAVGDGVTDDTVAIQAAAAAGKKIIFPYKQTFKVAGNSDIIFNNSVDFNNCTLDVSSYNHDIYLNSGSSWVNYNSTSNVVTELQNASTLDKRYWSSWLNTTEVDESFVKVNTNQPYYRYRDDIINRQDFNVVTRWGQVLSTPAYTLTTSTVTSVDVLSINKHVTTYSDVIIKTGSNDTNSSYLKTWDSTRVRLVNVAFDVDSTLINANRNPVYYSINNSYDIEVDGLHCSFPSHTTQGSGYTYNLSIEGCYDVRIKKAIGQGDGWGATGSNLSQRVLFEDCDLNRIDFHKPVLEYLKVHNCRVGSWGILVSTIGDLEVTSSSFTTNSANYRINKGIIRSRGDTGGFCTGNLLVRDCIIDSDSQSYPVTLCTGDATQTPPAGSPLEYYYWKSELYENLESIGSTIRIGGAEGLPSFMRASRQVIMNNLKGNFQHNGGISSGKGAFDLAGTDVIQNTANRLVTIKNSRMHYLGCADSSNTFIYKYFIENVYFDEDEGTGLEIVARGIFDITNSELEGLDCYSGGVISTQAFITIRDSVIRHTQRFNSRCFNSVDADVVSLSLINNKLLLVNSGDMIGSDAMGSAFLSNNDVYFNGNYITDYTISSSSTFTLPTGFNSKNKVLIVTGYNGNNTAKYTECRLPTVTGHSTVTSIDGTDYVTITANSSNVNNITVTTGSAPYRFTGISFRI